MANLAFYRSALRQIAKLIDNGDGTYSEQVAVVNGATALALSRPARTPIVLATVTNRAVAGLNSLGSFASVNGWAGGWLYLLKTAGDAVTLAINDPTGGFALATAPASAAGVAASAIDIGPGVSGASPGFAIRVAGQLPDGWMLTVTHSTAVAASYTVTFYPCQ